MNFVFFQSTKIGLPVLNYQVENLLRGLRGQCLVTVRILEHHLQVIVIDVLAQVEKELPELEIRRIIQVFCQVAKVR